MTIIGNILLFITTILFFELASIISKPAPGGDAAVGYGWSIIILNALFIICMIIVTAIIGFKGGFSWVSSEKTYRFLIVAAGLFFSLVALVSSSLFKHENGPVPFLLRTLSLFVPLLIPVVLIVSSFILLNKNIRISVPATVYVAPLIVVSSLGIIGFLSGVYAFASQSIRNRQAALQSIVEQQDSNHKRMLAEIDSCDVTKDMVFILVMTDANQDEDVRTKAVAKVKTNPQWQQELVRRLKSDWAPEAFTFLASNGVDDANLFPEAVEEGVLRQARLIRESIRKSSYFYSDQFYWEVERVLRTVNRYKGMAVDFLPSVKELRASLNEPTAIEKPVFSTTRLLDDWIKKYS